ncbi:AraC family transcriptional regulator [Microlunatus speluncae]|uniref:AraC family transcriptional regulator n=1 Tax=Microlunatus speluncae TaxID=2594267 RepID=UPI001C2D7005|nr:AraC family transcriptional regulator [Microlunatus speluncae]
MFGYRRIPGVPPVMVFRQDHSAVPAQAVPHAHDFLVLGFVVAGTGTVRLNTRDWRLRPGDLFLVAPTEVIDIDRATAGPGPVETWTAFFPPDAIDPDALRAWRDHPLLAPFVRPGGGIQRIPVPEPERERLVGHFRELERELRERRDGFAEAALARLTLLLVEVRRLAADIPGGLRLRDEPLLADVFDLIETRFGEPISLRDVAAAVAVTPAHLTTVVRRKSGRTVQQWITERRMIEARRLLAETTLPVAAIAGRAGFTDPGYFSRVFRRDHGVSPHAWRRDARA